MNLILCLDNRGGMLFNHRRLSRDEAVSRHCLALTAGKKLWMNAYSYKLFETRKDIVVAEVFWQTAGEDDFCFAETEIPELSSVKRLYVYRWNRDYPSDVRFCPEDAGFHKVAAEDISGKSHPVITVEVYEH